jgi:AcrR family transcriptional regulator
MAVFAERGYDAASMSEIARAAGITPAVIYDHFSSKAALQVELLEGQTADLIGYVAAALDRAPDGPEPRFRAGCDAYFRFVEEHPLAWRILFGDPPGDPEVAAAHRRINEQATAAISSFIKASAATQLLSYADPDQAAEMLAEMLKMSQYALASWWYEHREVPREEILNRLVEFCWIGLGRVAAGERQDASTP